MANGGPFPVLVHPYESRGGPICAYEIGDSSSKNAILFAGGLHDGPHTAAFIRAVSGRLQKSPELSFSVFEIRMRSSFIGFGTSSLTEDVEDISALVKYLRSIGREKIVLFGHSTGCQDCLEYTKYSELGNEPVDGFILQGPVSDGDCLQALSPNYKECLECAEKMIAEGRANDCVPRDMVPALLGGAPMTAYRLHSLLGKGTDDDYFSVDFDDATLARIWGRFQVPALILHSEKDEYVPEGVDQKALNDKYCGKNSKISALSGLIPGASHQVLQQDARDWLGDRVIKFLEEMKP